MHRNRNQEGPAKWLQFPDAPRPEFPAELMNPRRIFLLMGWARWLIVHGLDIKEAQDMMMKRRPQGRWAILVADDRWALAYQMLEFELRRCKLALTWYHPMASRSTMTDNLPDDPPGMIRWETAALEEMRNEERAQVDKLRVKAGMFRRLPKLEAEQDNEPYHAS